MKRFVLRGVVAVCVLLTSAGNAYACGEMRPFSYPLKDAYANASLIFYGSVTEVGATTQYEQVSTGRLVTFEVRQVWKDTFGYARGKQDVVIRGFDDSAAQFEFVKGKRYIVYAKSGGGRAAPPASTSCDRTRPVVYAEDDIRWLSQKTGMALHSDFKYHKSRPGDPDMDFYHN